MKRDFELLHSVRGKYVSKTFVAPGTGAFEPFFGWTDTVVRKIRRSDVHASIKPILRTIFHDGAHDRCWGHVYHTRACLTLAGGAGDWESHMRSPDPCRGRRRLGGAQRWRDQERHDHHLRQRLQAHRPREVSPLRGACSCCEERRLRQAQARGEARCKRFERPPRQERQDRAGRGAVLGRACGGRGEGRGERAWVGLGQAVVVRVGRIRRRPIVYRRGRAGNSAQASHSLRPPPRPGALRQTPEVSGVRGVRRRTGPLRVGLFDADQGRAAFGERRGMRIQGRVSGGGRGGVGNRSRGALPTERRRCVERRGLAPAADGRGADGDGPHAARPHFRGGPAYRDLGDGAD